MKLVVLRTSGGIGRLVTRLAARRGHAITALIRPVLLGTRGER